MTASTRDALRALAALALALLLLSASGMDDRGDRARDLAGRPGPSVLADPRLQGGAR